MTNNFATNIESATIIKCIYNLLNNKNIKKIIIDHKQSSSCSKYIGCNHEYNEYCIIKAGEFEITIGKNCIVPDGNPCLEENLRYNITITAKGTAKDNKNGFVVEEETVLQSYDVPEQKYDEISKMMEVIKEYNKNLTKKAKDDGLKKITEFVENIRCRKEYSSSSNSKNPKL
ncbi:MAG: hypothetical protein CVU81_00185 [Euryarchaeota archaeon HGW-Euryarchaeota-1]|nr:MAG: hypothetical protein CVU81_00185 [Euryarchaeota archaeon HGW-Euryarchaeota-1]